MLYHRRESQAIGAGLRRFSKEARLPPAPPPCTTRNSKIEHPSARRAEQLTQTPSLFCRPAQSPLHTNSRIVIHASDDEVVRLDGPLAVPRGDVPVPHEEASAGRHDLRPVRVQGEGDLNSKTKKTVLKISIKKNEALGAEREWFRQHTMRRLRERRRGVAFETGAAKEGVLPRRSKETRDDRVVGAVVVVCRRYLCTRHERHRDTYDMCSPVRCQEHQATHKTTARAVVAAAAASESHKQAARPQEVNNDCATEATNAAHHSCK